MFTTLIFLSHYVSYFIEHNIDKYDSLYMTIREHLNQTVVVPYLFYSGYGMTISLFRKGESYIRSIVRYRIPRVFLSMAIAVTLFLILKIFKGEEINGHQVLMSYVFWDSLGNSNWYIFGILGEYSIFVIAFLLCREPVSKRNLFAGLILTTVLTCVFVLWIKSQGKGPWWYNTLIMFPVGCWYAFFAKRIDAVQRSHITYLKTAITLSILYCFTFFYRSQGLMWYSLWIVTFMGSVLLITMKIEFNSSIFQFFGNHVFSIYILQRIPMIILAWIGWMSDMPYLSFCIALMLTCLMAIVFDRGTHVLFGKIGLLPYQVTVKSR